MYYKFPTLEYFCKNFINMNSIAYLKFRKNGKLETKGFYKNGYRTVLKIIMIRRFVLYRNIFRRIKRGVWKYYYESGFLSSVCSYKKGKKRD